MLSPTRIPGKCSVEVRLDRRPARGGHRLRIAMVGRPNAGKSTVFDAVASTSVEAGELAGSGKPYRSCVVQVGAREVDVVDLPGIEGLCDLDGRDREGLKYLLWGDRRPAVSSHDDGLPTPFARPDALVQILDASKLASSLKLTLELAELGLPMVVGLNMMDEARRKGMLIDVARLATELGVPVVPMVGLKGHGISELFSAAVLAAASGEPSRPPPLASHLAHALERAAGVLGNGRVHAAFNVPARFLLAQLMRGDSYFGEELASHFPLIATDFDGFRAAIASELPRPLDEEMRTDLSARATAIAERSARQVHRSRTVTWEDRFDGVFLHPRWGLIGSLAVFSAVLFVVFELSATLDALTSARLADMVAQWHPVSTAGVVGHAVLDGLVGLIGIVVPYMLPLVALLVFLEESGVMQRIAFVVDRFLHGIGLHGNVAMPFLLGLGCNVPAIAAVRAAARGRDRAIAALLVIFVPCSARSAVLLAVGGKYLGAGGVVALFAVNIAVIGLLGRLFMRRYPGSTAGVIQRIPPYRVPSPRRVLHQAWARSSDVVTIVTPLLVGGSVVLALLQHAGAAVWIDAALAPVTTGALGLPIVLGVPLLFGVLRKELSLLMVYQALGTADVGAYLDWVQISVFLVFVMLYLPCVSTFAAMLRAIGRREAVQSIGLSIGVALLVAIALRALLLSAHLLA